MRFPPVSIKVDLKNKFKGWKKLESICIIIYYLQNAGVKRILFNGKSSSLISSQTKPKKNDSHQDENGDIGQN